MVEENPELEVTAFGEIKSNVLCKLLAISSELTLVLQERALEIFDLEFKLVELLLKSNGCMLVNLLRGDGAG